MALGNKLIKTLLLIVITIFNITLKQSTYAKHSLLLLDIHGYRAYVPVFGVIYLIIFHLPDPSWSHSDDWTS